MEQELLLKILSQVEACEPDMKKELKPFQRGLPKKCEMCGKPFPRVRGKIGWSITTPEPKIVCRDCFIYIVTPSPEKLKEYYKHNEEVREGMKKWK